MWKRCAVGKLRLTFLLLRAKHFPSMPQSGAPDCSVPLSARHKFHWDSTTVPQTTTQTQIYSVFMCFLQKLLGIRVNHMLLVFRLVQWIPVDPSGSPSGASSHQGDKDGKTGSPGKEFLGYVGLCWVSGGTLSSITQGFDAFWCWKTLTST